MYFLKAMLFLLLLGISVAAQAVDQDIQVDMLQRKAAAALKAERPADALPSFAQLESMESSLTLPEDYYYFYIDALDKTGNKAKALVRANGYLSKFGKNGNRYTQVIDIINRLQDEVDREAKAAVEAAAEARRKEAEAAAEARRKEVKRMAEEDAKKKRESPIGDFVSLGGLTWMPSNSLQMTWSDADAYCSHYSINGQTGWRLPTKSELVALKNSDAMEAHGWQMYYAWTISDDDNTFYTPSDHCQVWMGTKSPQKCVSNTKNTSTASVTCVR